MDTSQNHKKIENKKQMEQFSIENSKIQWIAFDTEYTTEKSYKPKLCLIQILTQNGKYIIDVTKVKNINLFSSMISDPKILKITHSGEHDYKILNDKYQIIPKNIFDTQIAYSFLCYQPRINLGDLIDFLLNKKIKKGLAASDWEKRPLSNRQIEYSLDDVIFLKDIKDILFERLKESKRLSWAQEEFKTLEYPKFYNENLIDDILDMHFTDSLSKDERIFLIKIVEWRKKEATKKAVPEYKILGFTLLKEFVTLLPLGEYYIKNNRRIPKKVLNEYLPSLDHLLKSPSKQYVEIEKQIPPSGFDEPELELLTKISYLFIKHLCFKNHIRPELICTETQLKFILWNENFETSKLFKGWRFDFVGKEINTILSSNKTSIDKFNTMCKILVTDKNNSNQNVNTLDEIDELVTLGFRRDILDNIPEKWMKATTLLLNQLPENHAIKQLPTAQSGLWILKEVRPILERLGVNFRKPQNKSWELKKMLNHLFVDG